MASDRLIAAVRALYIDGLHAGMEEAAEIGGYQAIMDARERAKREAGRFFDEMLECGEWAQLQAVLAAIAKATAAPPADYPAAPAARTQPHGD